MTHGEVTVVGRARSRALFWIALAEVLTMSAWFAVPAAGPDISQAWRLSPGDLAALTVATQTGFVVGLLMLAMSGVNDIVAARRILVVAALATAGANAALLLADGRLDVAFVIRFGVGISLAAFYPTGMKVVASWYDRSRGMAIGVVVGALTLGTASPHLVAGLGAGHDWRIVIALASVASLAAALISLTLVREGPFRTRALRFDGRAAFRGLRDPAMRLANIAYFGHMWEVYGMWAWIPAYLLATFAVHGIGSGAAASVIAAVAIGAGAVGCVLSGALGDRYGRTTVISVAMAVSGVCAALAGVLFGADPFLISVLAVVWGVAVIADSPHFSAAVTELAPPDRVGTSLSMQMAVGYLLSAVSIQVIPMLADVMGWTVAFLVLAAGPAVGLVAVLRLRARPEAIRMASGRR